MDVLIIDDESIVRAGIKNIIDWESYGFKICGEADNGEDGLRKIIELNPDLVLLDIKMPGMYGVDVAKQAREKGYTGKIIILSGYSDFEYAHDAIKSGVDAYLLKPIDEDELIEAITRVKNKLETENTSNMLFNKSMHHMKEKIINDIICNSQEALKIHTSDELSLYNVDLRFDCFQVAVVESFSNASISESQLRAELFREYGGDESNIDTVCINDKTVILLKGSDAVRHMPIAVEHMLNRSRNREAKIFIGVGRCVNSVNDIYLSYRDARKITERKFFYDENRCIVLWNETNENSISADKFTNFDIGTCAENLKNFIEIGDQEQLLISLEHLKDDIRHMDVEPEKIVTLIVNIYTQLKRRIQQSYPHLAMDAAGNGFRSDIEIMNHIYGKKSLYEVIEFLYAEFLAISEKIGNISNKSLMKKIENYILKNYAKDLKLEAIAQLFGYNSAYLGKMFKKTFGENFNTYLDKVRINEAKRLLLNESLKVYEVSEQVGFKNIDYFYKKFKRYVRQSPKEFRKDNGIASEVV